MAGSPLRSDIGTSGGPITVRADRLEPAVVSVFRAAGSNPTEAEIVAEHLVGSNLAGHDSHGVGLLKGYLAAVKRGDLVLDATPAIAGDRGPLVVIDGRRGAGAAVATTAMEIGSERARKHGFALVALRDAYHIGRIGAWAEHCAQAGLVSVHFVNVPAHAAVAPFGGLEARLGTNPFAAGFPRSGDEPVIVDFATSRWAVGKVQVARRKGTSLPPGILLDGAGRETDDPAALYGTPRGALFPFGEHKGFGLGLACELLAGALTGGLTQHGTPSEAITNSMLSLIVAPETFGDRATYDARCEALLAWVRSARSDAGGVKLPGEPERERRAVLLRDGIVLDPVTWSDMTEAAAGVGIDDFAARAGLG